MSYESRTWTFAFAAFALGLAGCSSMPALSACVPGRVESCPCVGAASGTQACLPDGTFGACTCAGADAGVDAALPTDATTTTDAATVSDGAVVTDSGGTTMDVGPTDTGIGVDAAHIHGHAVVLGYDGFTANDSVDAMITNSVFLSERLGTAPLRVLEYTQFAIDTGSTRLHGLLDDAGTTRGRTLVYSDLASSSASTFASSIASADVLLVHAQYMATLDFPTVGASWHDTVIAFLDAGGVVVILMNLQQDSWARHDEWALASGTGLFNASGSFNHDGSPQTEIATPTDPVAAGVLTPYAAPVIGLAGMTGGVPVARTSVAVAVPAFTPTVRHLTR